jgi:Protein of unknown function (DUF2752)
MQLSWRRLGPHETDHELLWLIVSVGALAAGAAWFALQLPWPRCLFHDFTGLPCLTCGATRSAIAFFHANFLAAWSWNPLAFVVWCVVALFDLYAITVLVARAPRFRIMDLTRAEKITTRILILALLGLNWVWVLQNSTALGI